MPQCPNAPMPQCANTLNAPCAQVEVADKPGDLMRTMKVWTNGRELSAPRDAVHHVGYNVTVSANALPIKKIGSESAEEVVIRTPAVSFTIWTQQANKFDEVEKRVKYAHLNMEVDGGLPESAEGIAAEFAGVRPMTAETEALLEMPVANPNPNPHPHPNPNPN